MKTLVPSFGPISMKRDMERFFDRMWDLEFPEVPAFGEWRPMLDVLEKDDKLLVKVEVPGIDPKDIRITVREDLLTIQGEKKQEEQYKDEHVYRMERSYGTFARTVRLPGTVDSKLVKAHFKNGLLTIWLPRVPAKDAEPIPIKVE